MPDQPNLSQPPPNLRSLAERFGMTQEAIEEILRGANEEYSPSVLQAVSLQEPTTKEEIPPAALPEVATSMPETPRSSDSQPTQRRSMPLSGGFMAAVFTVLLIVLGIAISFRYGCFRQPAQHVVVPPVDSVQNLLSKQAQEASTPPQPPSQVPPEEVPPEALNVPTNDAPQPKKERRSVEPRASATAKPDLETISSYEAQEQLAELRADGESKAHLKKVVRGGLTRYQVFRR